MMPPPFVWKCRVSEVWSIILFLSYFTSSNIEFTMLIKIAEACFSNKLESGSLVEPQTGLQYLLVETKTKTLELYEYDI